PERIILGVLLASALVSMWVSNTATAMMMLPIALSIVRLLPHDGTARALPDFRTALLLAVAYGATTGGMGTLIGTPPNALLAAYMSDICGVEIGFAQWMLLGVPVVALALPVVHLALTRLLFRPGRAPLPGVADLIARE